MQKRRPTKRCPVVAMVVVSNRCGTRGLKTRPPQTRPLSRCSPPPPTSASTAATVSNRPRKVRCGPAACAPAAPAFTRPSSPSPFTNSAHPLPGRSLTRKKTVFLYTVFPKKARGGKRPLGAVLNKKESGSLRTPLRLPASASVRRSSTLPTGTPYHCFWASASMAIKANTCFAPHP